MKRSFLAGLAVALGVLALLTSTAASEEKPADQVVVNDTVVVPQDDVKSL